MGNLKKWHGERLLNPIASHPVATGAAIAVGVVLAVLVLMIYSVLGKLGRDIPAEK